MPLSRRLLLAGLSSLPAAPALAQGAAPAPSRPVLTVSGRIAPAGGAGPVHFTLAEFEALGMAGLVTETAWTQGPQSFAGVPLRALLQAVGAQAPRLRLVALNDYAVEVPAEDGERHGALLATRLAGQPMPVREKGPIWLIYPWSARPELRTMDFNKRSIWQLRRIEVG